MIPIEGQPILTAAQMRAAEEEAIAAGSSVEELMERAGAAVAEAVRRLAAGAPVVILCGPGNNGGDGYVAARILAAHGVDVRVAAVGEPRTAAAIAARAGWAGVTDPIETAARAPVVVDAVFGTGLSRMVDDALTDAIGRFDGTIFQSPLRIAVDVPTGLDSDTGAMLCSSIGRADVTLALGAVKPVHVLSDSADLCGEVRVIDIGVDLPFPHDLSVIGHPWFAAPNAGSNKYNRGMVAIVGGAMPGAAALAAEAAMRAGAGYALLLADERPAGLPHAVVSKPWSGDALADDRIGALLIGPGLGRDDTARAKLDAALASEHTLVIDGDALHLLDGRDFHERALPVVLTPHAGEFAAMFGKPSGSKIEAARDAARRSGAVVIFKGPDTVIADPGGEAIVAPNGSPWLSTAGTGDVLAGAVAACATSAHHSWVTSAAGGVTALIRTRAESAVWLHGEAAQRLGTAFIADDLLRELSAVRASL